MRRALYVLAACQLADVLTTAYASAHGGIEANPVMRAALAVGGFAAFFAVKAAVFAVCAFLATAYEHRWEMRLAVVVGIVLTASVAVSNLLVGGI